MPCCLATSRDTWEFWEDIVSSISWHNAKYLTIKTHHASNDACNSSIIIVNTSIFLHSRSARKLILTGSTLIAGGLDTQQSSRVDYPLFHAKRRPNTRGTTTTTTMLFIMIPSSDYTTTSTSQQHQ